MWILPKNLHTSAYVQDMEALTSDLNELSEMCEQSLLVRSKPLSQRTWLRKWKRDGWTQHLFGRILKPSQHTYFEEQLTLSLAAILASRSQQQDSEKEKMIPDTCGRQSESMLKPSDQIDAFSRMSKDTYRLDCPQSSATWKKMVTEQRGEYSQRVKLAHLTKEKESTSWPTATVFDVTGGSYPTELVNGQWRSKHSKDPNSPWYGAKLRDAVETAEKVNWPTPSARDHKGGYQGGRIRNGKVSLDTLDVAVQHYSGDKTKVGHLNPDWVEWLMGVPTGWTGLGSWETE